MLSLRRILSLTAPRSQAAYHPASLKLALGAVIFAFQRYASSERGSSRMQEKDQTHAEQQAKYPKKMANLGAEGNKRRDGPHQTSGDLSTPGVKGKGKQDEPIGRNVNNKASG